MEIEFNFIILIAFIAMYVFFRTLLCFVPGRGISFRNEVTNLGLYMSIVAVFAATLFPIRFGVPFEGFEIYNLIPLKVPIDLIINHGIWYFLYQVLGNIALFVPFGFFIYKKSNFNIRGSILACLALTLFVEITQGFIPYRFCEIDDVWLNTLGGYIGIYMYSVCIRMSSKYLKSGNFI